jgi:putative hemolysin
VAKNIKRSEYLIPYLFALTIVFFFCTLGPAHGNGLHKPGAGSGLANPASTYCLEKGGELIIQKRNDGGEYGVCVFADKGQCEEWALFRGECPVGGIRVNGCVTPAALFCAITGGQYSEFILKSGNNESGVCSFINGRRCDAWEYYNGNCSKYQ